MREIIDIEKYLEEIDNYSTYSNVMYRGQSDSRFKNISASINRDVGYSCNEECIIREALEKKEKDFRELKLPIEKLAKMQHYGFPTRLIDVTRDPLIALYFAVENVENLNDGEVFIFIKNTYDIKSKQANIISLLSNMKSYDMESIKIKYEEIYNEKISSNEIVEYVGQNIYIVGTERIEESNERLVNQRGSFVICGNEISENKITSRLLNINKNEAHEIIRIPFEHKKIIKDILDKEYKINESFVYPELQSFASYIKNKYKDNNLNLDNAFKIEKSEDNSIPGVRREAIYIILNRRLNIYEIKKIVKLIIDKRKIDIDVVRVFVAGNSSDYIMSNWIIEALWIREELDLIFKPIDLSELDENGVSWKKNVGVISLNNYYEENVFEDNKKLFIYNDKAFNKIKKIYEKLQELFMNNSLDVFQNSAKEYEEAVKEIYFEMMEFGCSRDSKFNEFLHLYQELIAYLDNIPVYLKNRELKKEDNFMIGKYFKEVGKVIEKIENNKGVWRSQLKITNKEYSQVRYIRKEREYTLFKPTIPIKENALDVRFEVSLNQLENNTLQIVGKTNLFDKASLMLTLTNRESYKGQDTVIVENGQFKSEIFSNDKIGLEVDKCKLTISLSIPRVQAKEFRDKAGLEYENLTGDFINREGMGPTGEYVCDFKV